MRYFLLIILTMITPINTLSASSIEGSGKITSETRSLSAFYDVSVHGKLIVFIKEGPTSLISIEGDDNIIPLIETSVKNSILTIGHQPDISLSTILPLIVKVTTPYINSIRLMGSGSLKSEGELQSHSFDLLISGSGSCDLTLLTDHLNVTIAGSGSCTTHGKTLSQEIRISGSGEYQGLNLSSHNTIAYISGSGVAKVFATDLLDIVITGSGKILYRGSPKLYKKITGIGSITQLPSESST